MGERSHGPETKNWLEQGHSTANISNRFYLVAVPGMQYTMAYDTQYD
jgi:hypothetical protein